MRWNFPLARRLLAFTKRAGAGWRRRHRHPVNYWLHLAGIPMAFLAIPLLLLLPWTWCVGLFVGGYFLQWLGHQFEGNDVGELIPLKRALGMRVVAVVPRPAPPTQTS